MLLHFLYNGKNSLEKIFRQGLLVLQDQSLRPVQSGRFAFHDDDEKAFGNGQDHGILTRQEQGNNARESAGHVAEWKESRDRRVSR